MARQLPLGRITKTQVPDAVRKSGVFASFGNKGFFGEYFDQLMFEAHQIEHILGNASQLASDFATITWSNANARFENKAGGLVTLGDYERIAVIGMDTLTANMVIDNVKGLEIKHIGATPGQTGDNPKLQLGDAGGEEPFKIRLGVNALDCQLNLLTDKPFADLDRLNLSIDQKQYVANQGKGNFIKVNGEQIYNPSSVGKIVKYDTQPKNPYLLRMAAADFPWSANAAVNNLAWFRDLNIALNGQLWNGSQFVETQGRFTPVAVVNYLFRLNRANRFFTDLGESLVPLLDTRIHERSDPTGVAVADTAAVSIGSNVVTFVSIADIKNNMRISGLSTQGIPDGVIGTTILKNINTASNTAEMFDALTGAVANATSSGSGLAVTMNNSGAAGGSHDEDAFQGHWHNIQTDDAPPSTSGFLSSTRATGPSTASTVPANWTAGSQTAPLVETTSPIDDGINDPPQTHNQTQPRSSAVYFYYKV